MLHPPVVSSQSSGGPVPSGCALRQHEVLQSLYPLRWERWAELDMFLSPDRLGSDKTAISLGSVETVFPESKLC